MHFSQDFIEKVRDANNIVEVIGQYTELKGSGHRLVGRCPFPDHSDKSPSFSVTEDNQLYYCYGCKKGGNIYTFLETFNGMSFPEAVEYLARRASVPMPEEEEGKKKSSRPSSELKDTLLKVNKAAAVFYHHQLKSLSPDAPAKQYLERRNLTEEIVEKFRLGYSSDEWQGLMAHFNSRRIPLKHGETLGLLKPKKQARADDSHFDLFRDRLMFPIFAPTGDVIGFGGRTLGDGLPKYVNSSDSPIFQKGRILYGLHETGKYIRAQDQAIVVEGYMDAISLYAAGIKNVVAILGTAFTVDHAKILKRYTLNVVMLLDGDEAGVTGAERSLPILLEAGLMPKGFLLPEKMDPDDYVKANGADALKSQLDRAADLFNLLLTKRWMTGYRGSPSDKVNVLQEASVSLKAMQNRQLLDLYILELSRQLDVEQSWIRKSLSQGTDQAQRTSPIKPRPVGAPVVPTPAASVSKEASRSATSGAPRTMSEELDQQSQAEDREQAEPIEKFDLKGAPKDEAFVLSLVLQSEILMKELVDAGVDDVLLVISHSGVRAVMAAAAQTFASHPEKFSNLAADFASRVDNPSTLMIAGPLLEQYRSSGSEGVERKVMADYLGAIRRRFLKTQGKMLASQLRESSSPESLEQKLEQFMNLQRSRLGLKASEVDSE